MARVFSKDAQTLRPELFPAFSVSDDSCMYGLTNPTCPEDLTQDGQVNTSDLLLFLGVYGEICN